MSVTFNFQGKIALVTGAGRGIGRDIAKALYAAGATTYALSVTKENLDSLVAECPAIHPVQVDLMDWTATEKAVEALGQIDLLVNNAGVAEFIPFFTATSEACDRIFGVNVKGLICVSQVVAKGMVSRRSGSIVNMSSASSSCGVHALLVYGASKAAIDQITRNMALELGPHQVRVNAVNPTVVDLTDMSRPLFENSTFLETMTKLTPLGKFAELKDVTNLVLYLLSDHSDMIHGTIIPVDGGFWSQGAITEHSKP